MLCVCACMSARVPPPLRTVPRSCLGHSITVSEAMFTDALAAVGLRVLTSESGAWGQPPPSDKIVYFECEAIAPSAEAAIRFQSARQQARQSQAQAVESAAQRRKSAGASFDVDIGVRFLMRI